MNLSPYYASVLDKKRKNIWSGVALTVLIVTTAFLGYQAHRLSLESRQIKEDLIELSSIKYGLFNVDEWKRILSEIVVKKIDELEVTDDNREEIREKVSDLLYKMLGRFEEEFSKENSGSIWGWLKKGSYSLFGIFEQLRDKVPEMTDEVISYLENKDKRKELADFINQKMEEYADSTFAQTDYSIHDAILNKYGYIDRIATLEGLPIELESLKSKERSIHVIILALAALVFVLLVLKLRYTVWHYTSFSIFALVLLALGLSFPMLDIDARITSLSFTLLGEKVEFLDQVLYFKSKSILEVVLLMLSQKQLEVILVGVLVLSFSVLFPLAKLISTNLYLHGNNLKDNGLIRFLVFKTGKWSMADVMVVAIFMAYIGFSGIISEQLKQLEGFSKNLEVLTTDGSTLQAGFFFFTAFVILSIALSQKVANSLKG